MGISFQGGARTIYRLANKLPGIKSYIALHGSRLDRGLNRVLGFKCQAQRLVYLMSSMIANGLEPGPVLSRKLTQSFEALPAALGTERNVELTPKQITDLFEGIIKKSDNVKLTPEQIVALFREITEKCD